MDVHSRPGRSIIDHALASWIGPSTYGTSDNAANAPIPATAATARQRPARAATHIPAAPMPNSRNAF